MGEVGFQRKPNVLKKAILFWDYYLGLDAYFLFRISDLQAKKRVLPDLFAAATIYTFGFNISFHHPLTENESKSKKALAIALSGQRHLIQDNVPLREYTNTTQVINPANWLLFPINFIQLGLFSLCNVGIAHLNDVVNDKNAFSLKRVGAWVAKKILQLTKVMTGLICFALKLPLRIAKLILTAVTGIIGLIVYGCRKLSQQREQNKQAQGVSNNAGNPLLKSSVQEIQPNKSQTPETRPSTEASSKENFKGLPSTPPHEQDQQFRVDLEERERGKKHPTCRKNLNEAFGAAKTQATANSDQDTIKILKPELEGIISSLEQIKISASNAGEQNKALTQTLNGLTELHNALRENKESLKNNPKEGKTLIIAYKEAKIMWQEKQKQFIKVIKNEASLSSYAMTYAKTMQNFYAEPLNSYLFNAEATLENYRKLCSFENEKKEKNNNKKYQHLKKKSAPQFSGRLSENDYNVTQAAEQIKKNPNDFTQCFWKVTQANSRANQIVRRACTLTK